MPRQICPASVSTRPKWHSFLEPPHDDGIEKPAGVSLSLLDSGFTLSQGHLTAWYIDAAAEHSRSRTAADSHGRDPATPPSQDNYGEFVGYTAISVTGTLRATWPAATAGP